MSDLVFTGLAGERRRVGVFSARRGDLLGVLSWYGRWHQYVLEPNPDAIWSAGCLDEVRATLDHLNASRRRGRPPRSHPLDDVLDPVVSPAIPEPPGPVP